MKLTGENRRTRGKSCPKIPHELTRDRTRASAMRGRWLTAWAMKRPWRLLILFLSYTNSFQNLTTCLRYASASFHVAYSPQIFLLKFHVYFLTSLCFIPLNIMQLIILINYSKEQKLGKSWHFFIRFKYIAPYNVYTLLLIHTILFETYFCRA